MTKRIVIWRGSRASDGARLLGNALGARVNRMGSDRLLRLRGPKLVVNWGSTLMPTLPPNYAVLNDPRAVAVACDKRETFRTWTRRAETREWIPPWTEEYEEAREWQAQGFGVLCRRMLRSHSGRGIILVQDKETTLPSAPLYVRYVPKRHEFRVHVFNGEVIDVTQKRKRQEVPNDECDYQIRNHGNGWIYARSEVTPPKALVDASLDSVRALGLDFGAVDVGWNQHYSRPTVYEVNSAPGLYGETTLRRYADAVQVYADAAGG